MDEIKLIDFQNELKSLKQTIECLKESIPQVSCIFNSEKLTENSIGTVDCNFKNFLKTININNQIVADTYAHPYGI